jgi:hypothetical protein
MTVRQVLPTPMELNDTTMIRYRADQQLKWKHMPKYPERTTDNGQTTGKLYHLRLRVERAHAVLVIGLYELLGNPTT